MSYYNIEDIKKKNEEVNKVSPTYCSARLRQSFLYLQAGLNHACHLTSSHPSELSEKNNASLHNTLFTKVQRKRLLNGIWPEDCSYCSKIEQLNDGSVSDRMLRNYEFWADDATKEDLDKVNNFESFQPSYLEVSFSNECNLQCTYCTPVFSSRWVGDLVSKGRYQADQYPEGRRAVDQRLLNYLKEEQENPHIKQFWKWLPELYPNLKVLRITGGEPMLSPHNSRLVSWVENNESNHQLEELSINSNLCVPRDKLEKVLKSLNEAKQKGKAKEVMLFASIDSWGSGVEYARHGIDLELFESNLKYILSNFPDLYVTLMVTYCIFTVPSYRGLLDKVAEWRKKFPSNGETPRIQLDTPVLQTPHYLRINELDFKYIEYMEKDFEFMKKSGCFYDIEIQKFERIISKFKKDKNNQPKGQYLKNFYHFVSEWDKRKGSDLIKSIPELSLHLQQAKDEAENLA